MKKEQDNMKTQNTFHSTFASISRCALAGSLALAALLLPRAAAAQEDKSSSNPNMMPGEDKSNGTLKPTQREDKSRWSLNFTPVLLMPDGDYHLGGGVDPELKYTLDRGGVRLSAGLRVGGYYAKNLFGITTMPTIRLSIPVGPVEPYASFGMGYGWLPKIHHSDVATMSRLGVVFHFSESFALGVEGTVQKIDGSDFAFPSFGSAVAINF
jgi:hypothetical protein